jgi:phage/plasmid-like protein (TIGR03299 family)
MAHELEIVDGVAQMAYAGETPWHSLGVQVSNDLTPDQIMKKAGLDWTVTKEALMTDTGIKVPGHMALIRDRDAKVLDVVGEDWNPIQNEDAFQFFSEYVLAGDMEMNTAGSLKGGRNVWALAKVKESFTILGKDQVDSYLLFSNPHQYGKAIDIRFTPIRVVCNNTLTFALNKGSVNQVKMNHRTKFDADEVKKTLGIAHAKFAEYKQMAEFLSTRKYTAEALIQYFNEVFPHTYNKEKSKSVQAVEDMTKNAQIAMAGLATQPGADLGAGTWWSAFNAVTFHTDHTMGRSADNRMESAWFGLNQARKVKAVKLATEMAKV